MISHKAEKKSLINYLGRRDPYNRTDYNNSAFNEAYSSHIDPADIINQRVTLITCSFYC